MTSPIRATTSAAYERMLKEGRLPTAQWAVWSLLYRHQQSPLVSGPGLTRNEIDRLLSQGQPNPTYSRRLTEMERLGTIERGPARRCSISRHLAETWWALDRLPVKPVALPVPPPQRDALLQRFGAAIIHEIEDGAAAADPAAFVRRWTSAVKEVGLR